MNQPEHPDLLLQQSATKSITRGARQTADTAAMEAYYDAIEAGKSKDEAGELFIKTFQKMVHGK